MINWLQTCRLKEPFSALSHLLGLLLSVAGMIVLVYFSFIKGNPVHLISFLVYGISLVLLYSASTLYHLLPLEEENRLTLLKFDQTMIFLLIAGTYTPVCTIALKGSLGIHLLTAIWIIALMGMVLRMFWNNLPGWFPVLLYIVMGYLFLLEIAPAMQHIPSGALRWLLFGGFFYTAGVIVFALKRPVIIPNVIESHELWHIFVLFGSFCHFWMMYKYILVLD